VATDRTDSLASGAVRSLQDARFEDATAEYGAALARLARAYEPDPDRRKDLLQEILIALWRSFAAFDERCSTRTWVYRVAHNVATSKVLRRRTAPLVSLDEVAARSGEMHDESTLDRQLALDRLLSLVQTLEPVDRRVILLYLEGVDAASIGEITGLSARNVATKIHRIKQVLAKRFHEGPSHGG
jgi:RNA polymerase sigma-70 factor (ECF subfamily)